jgi:hypothetical protein
LKNRAIGSPSTLVSKNAAFELALCYMLGFGVPKDDAKSESLLNQSMRQQRDLDYKIDQIKQDKLSQDFQDGTYRRLEAEGYIRRVEFARYHREKERLDKIELEYRREILDIQSVLGAEHSIVQYLKSLLSSILESHGRWVEVEELRVQVMDEKDGARSGTPRHAN